jgi:hypothetical protein
MRRRREKSPASAGNRTPEPRSSSTKFIQDIGKGTILGGSLAITAWRGLRVRMAGIPPGTEGSCEYIK